MPDAAHTADRVRLAELLALRDAARLIVHAFAWTEAQTARQTIKAVWTGPGQRRPLYGVAAKRALASKRGAAAPAPAPPTPSGNGPAPAPFPSPAAPSAPAQPRAPAAPPQRGKLGRAAGAVGRGAKALARAKLRAGSAAAGASIATGARAAQALGYAQDRLGALLERVPVLESVFGVGSGMRKAARRQMAQARQTALLAATGNRGAAAKRAATGLATYLDMKFPENVRRFGVVRGIVIESAILGLKLAGGVGAAAGAALLTGAAAPGLGALASGGAALTGVAAAAFLAKKLIKTVLNPLTRYAVEYPFRAGRGGRGTGTPGRVLEARMARTRARQARGRAPRPADMTAAPAAVSQGAREKQAATGARGFVPVGGRGATSRRTLYAEPPAGAVDPRELVAALRQQLGGATGEPVDASDEDLADLLAEALGFADELGAGMDEGTADAFAEVSAHWTEADWDAFTREVADGR